MKRLEFTKRFQKDLVRLERRGKDIKKLKDIVTYVARE